MGRVAVKGDVGHAQEILTGGLCMHGEHRIAADVNFLHPCAAVPLSRTALPGIPFFGLADGWRDGQVETIDL